MAFSAEQIIPVNVMISPQGLGYANFGSAMLFIDSTELGGLGANEMRTYSSLTQFAADFDSTTEAYAAASKWLGGIPATRSLTVWGIDENDLSLVDTLNKARDSVWWFYSFFNKSVYADTALVNSVAAWHDSVGSFFMNCATGDLALDIRDPAKEDDIASLLTLAGHRMTATVAHATDPYAGIAACKWFAAVDYGATFSTITGEGKKLAGVVAESLTNTAYTSMMKDTKKCAFYSVVDLQGSTDAGRLLNTRTHSTYGEFMDDAVNLAAFTNRLTVDLYNVIMNQTTKLGQDVVGQAVIIGQAKTTCELFRSNGYLGARVYLDPDDGTQKYTIGYEVLTKPEEIELISDADRGMRLAAPLRIRIFRRGAIHKAAVDVSVY